MSEFAVELTHLFVSPGHDFYGRHGKGREDHGIEDRDDLELVAGSGIVDDRFFDYKEDYKGQITFFDFSTYEAVMDKFELPDLEPGVFRRNVVVKGVSLPDLIGKRFRIGDLEFTGSEEAKPCYWMDQACAPGTEEFLRGHGGLRCRIVEGGVLGKGSQTLKVV
jgi:MOSC domain-containing protein YiiM